VTAAIVAASAADTASWSSPAGCCAEATAGTPAARYSSNCFRFVFHFFSIAHPAAYVLWLKLFAVNRLCHGRTKAASNMTAPTAVLHPMHRCIYAVLQASRGSAPAAGAELPAACASGVPPGLL